MALRDGIRIHNMNGEGRLNRKKVEDRCDTLRDLIAVGPGENPDFLRKALSVVRSLGAAAEWEYPRQIIQDLKVRLPAWFSDRQWRGDEAEQRRSLLQHIDQLSPYWEPPAGDFPTQPSDGVQTARQQ